MVDMVSFCMRETERRAPPPGVTKKLASAKNLDFLQILVRRARAGCRRRPALRFATSATRRSGFFFPSRLDPNRRAFKSKGPANLILKETLIREVEFPRAIGKDNECRWRNCSLSHVLNADSAARRRSALEIHALQKTIHLSSRDSLAALLSDALYGGEDAV